jgi:hypothetical protein
MEKGIEQKFPIKCVGRNFQGREALKDPIDVEVTISKIPDSDTIESLVKCPYNTGGHGQRCKASHPDVDKVGEGVGCPYSFDIPYALEIDKDYFTKLLQLARK